MVFPAHAGMSPPLRNIKDAQQCFPRTRGDEPPGFVAGRIKKAFSPHTRG